MRKSLKRILHHYRQNLVGKVYPNVAALLACLVTDGTFSPAEEYTVLSLPNRHNQVRALLDILETKENKVFGSFTNSLRSICYTHLAKTLEEDAAAVLTSPRQADIEITPRTDEDEMPSPWERFVRRYFVSKRCQGEQLLSVCADEDGTSSPYIQDDFLWDFVCSYYDFYDVMPKCLTSFTMHCVTKGGERHLQKNTSGKPSLYSSLLESLKALPDSITSLEAVDGESSPGLTLEISVYTTKTIEEAKAIVLLLPFMPRLKELYVFRVQIEDGTAADLSEAFVHLKDLRVLSLHTTNLSTNGAGILAEQLPHLLTLEELVIAFNRIGDAGAKSLGRKMGYLKRMKVLNLQGNGLTHEGALAALESAPQFEQVKFSHISISDDGAESLGETLASMQKLKAVHLNFLNMSVQAWSVLNGHLAQIEQLEVLDMDKCSSYESDINITLTAYSETSDNSTA
ncbi:uncharacterized protein [Branchiostoma lanceolatum]|uniref:uncharacterized protein n=1 Tax=Branchiostoma lanceolatum TaxID=7740 RepID=UPI0034514A8C